MGDPCFLRNLVLGKARIRIEASNKAPKRRMYRLLLYAIAWGRYKGNKQIEIEKVVEESAEKRGGISPTSHYLCPPPGGLAPRLVFMLSLKCAARLD